MFPYFNEIIHAHVHITITDKSVIESSLIQWWKKIKEKKLILFPCIWLSQIFCETPYW